MKPEVKTTGFFIKWNWAFCTGNYCANTMDNRGQSPEKEHSGKRIRIA
jgi:hypothetical protein